MSTEEFTARFESFYIRYEADDVSLTAIAWEVVEWEGVEPVFWNAGPNAPGKDYTKVRHTFKLWTKWDGCSHLWVEYLHFDEWEAFEAFGRCVQFIRDDLCEKHGIVD